MNRIIFAGLPNLHFPNSEAEIESIIDQGRATPASTTSRNPTSATPGHTTPSPIGARLDNRTPAQIEAANKSLTDYETIQSIRNEEAQRTIRLPSPTPEQKKVLGPELVKIWHRIHALQATQFPSHEEKMELVRLCFFYNFSVQYGRPKT